MHSDPTAGHFHKEATIKRTRKRYYWPSMYPDIIQYVQNCDACQKREGTKPSKPLRPIKQDTTQATLFELVYGRTATLPVEIEVNTYPTEPITEDNFQEMLLRRT
ncbi:hypothetical protein G9A89_018079 [Geosiphon pyriformis]|nr:hypothetical protein G9A89_018079 [Geosiphon pyriformis]